MCAPLFVRWNPGCVGIKKKNPSCSAVARNDSQRRRISDVTVFNISLIPWFINLSKYISPRRCSGVLSPFKNGNTLFPKAVVSMWHDVGGRKRRREKHSWLRTGLDFSSKLLFKTNNHYVKSTLLFLQLLISFLSLWFGSSSRLHRFRPKYHALNGPSCHFQQTVMIPTV